MGPEWKGVIGSAAAMSITTSTLNAMKTRLDFDWVLVDILRHNDG